ncbi:MAG: hypothetical protein U0Z26_14550 [Anaerolineales bacterium]
MKQKRIWVGAAIVVFLVLLGEYYVYRLKSANLPEQPMTQIPMLGFVGGPVADAKAELSGLAWFGDNLILLPQYPSVFRQNNEDGFLFYIPKAEILTYLAGKDKSPLLPRPIQLIAPGLAEEIPNYQGFEAIGFNGTQIFLTIEAGSNADDMQGYLISGSIAADLSTLTLDTTKLTKIDPQAHSNNHTDESLLVLKDKVITFYEVNGVGIIPKPVAHVFGFDLQPQGTIPMKNLEYRLTDTALGTGDTFWGINYFFPGDLDLLPKTDPIKDKYGTGKTHSLHPQVERLVEFKYSDSGITLVDTPPILLTLYDDARNWEGLVRLDNRGFLMVTDKFPTTILGFVPTP